MARGKALSDDLRDVLLHMAQSLDINTITHYTGCKRRTVERILSDFRRTGSVSRQHLRLDPLQGRRRAVKDQDVQVSLYSLVFNSFSHTFISSFCKALFTIALMSTLMKCRSCWRHVGALMLARLLSGGLSLEVDLQ